MFFISVKKKKKFNFHMNTKEKKPKNPHHPDDDDIVLMPKVLWINEWICINVVIFSLPLTRILRGLSVNMKGSYWKWVDGACLNYSLRCVLMKTCCQNICHIFLFLTKKAKSQNFSLDFSFERKKNYFH